MPSKPNVFSVFGAPVGVEVEYLSFWQRRQLITPRSLLAHTNGASSESTIEAQVRWAEANPGVNTAPHYLIDRRGRARKTLPSNRRGIGNATVTSGHSKWGSLTAAQRADITAHGQIRDWSLVVETTDLGWGPGDPAGNEGYTDAQGERLAEIIAYEAEACGFPIVLLPAWWAAGVASHTSPFNYPYTTLYAKACPGAAKIRDMNQWVLPRAQEIHAEWFAPPPPPPPPLPVFDPANGEFGLWPVGAKPPVAAFSNGDAVRYAKGVMRAHVARFARWFGANGEAGDGMVAFVNRGQHFFIRRDACLTWGAALCDRLDPNNEWFDGDMHDAVVMMQAGFGDAVFGGRPVGALAADGVIGVSQTWPFLDSLADGFW